MVTDEQYRAMQLLGLISAARWLKVPYWELAKRPMSEVGELMDMMTAVGSVESRSSSVFMEE